MAEVARLDVHRLSGGRPGALLVGEEGFADVRERQLFGVVEGLDRRVLAGRGSPPDADQARKRGQLFVKFHALTLERGPSSLGRNGCVWTQAIGSVGSGGRG